MSDQPNADSQNPNIQPEEIRKKFQDFIVDGFKELAKEDQVIANMAYKRGGVKKEGISVSLKEVNEKQTTTDLVFEIKIAKSKYDWKINWALSNSDKNSLEFRFSNSGASRKFLEIGDSIADEDGVLKEIAADSISLPGVRNGVVNPYFMDFWFSSITTEEAKKKNLSISRNPDDWCGDVYKDAWAKIKLTGTSFTIPEVPSPPDFKDNDSEETQRIKKDWAAFFLTLITWRFIVIFGPDTDVRKSFLTQFSSNEDTKNNVIEVAGSTFFKCLPLLKEYRPTRPVDINPHKLFDKITKKDDEEEGLQVPWHVIAAASAALNAGKHIIFTGPPGCGKTHIAKLIATHSSHKSPLMATASQAWSTDEVMGRYMPTIDGKGLEFKDGFFLKALDGGQWLIIDEINRCDIDNCFGELFTVLAGQSVVLPFEKVSNGSVGAEKALPIHIVVGNDSTDESDTDRYTSIQFPETFRLLATMNDADVAGLNQLSYALRRRFAIIRVEAPNDTVKEEIFNDRVKNVYEDLNLRNQIYAIGSTKKKKNIEFQKLLKEQLKKIFAKLGDSNDLIDLRIVGIAPVLDIIRFVGEGLRASSENSRIVTYKKDLASNKKVIEKLEESIRKELLHSFFAMGLVLNVYPQMDAVVGDEVCFKTAVRCMLDAFKDDEVFWHIEMDDKSDQLVIACTLATDKEKLSIRGYLIEKLQRQYATDHTTLGWIKDAYSSKEAGVKT